MTIADVSADAVRVATETRGRFMDKYDPVKVAQDTLLSYTYNKGDHNDAEAAMARALLISDAAYNRAMENTESIAERVVRAETRCDQLASALRKIADLYYKSDRDAPYDPWADGLESGRNEAANLASIALTLPIKGTERKWTTDDNKRFAESWGS